MTELQTILAQHLLSRNYSVEAVAGLLGGDTKKSSAWWHARLIELIDKGDLTA